MQPLLNIPQANGPVATARGDGATISRKIERVDILFVSREGVSDRLVVNVPYLCIEVSFAI